MRYKVGDKVRISKCNVEILKGQIDVIEEVYPHDNSYKLSRFDIRIAESNLRPAEFKIWCETEEELKAVLDEINNEKYFEKHEAEYWHIAPVGIIVEEIKNVHQCVVRQCIYKSCFDEHYGKLIELTPSEFTGIDFSEKIIIIKTPTGATATYGDKTVTTEGDFDDASRQALVEVLCPFKVGDRVKNKYQGVGEVTNIQSSSDYNCIISVYYEDSDYNGKHYERELEPYTEPLYNAKLFCIKGSDRFKVGYVYEVKNGMFNDTPTAFNDLNDINGFCSAQFMEVKGGLDD